MRSTRRRTLRTTCGAILLILASGCGTSGGAGDYCRIAEPILISADDDLTVETAQAILIHNEQGERLCGW